MRRHRPRRQPPTGPPEPSGPEVDLHDLHPDQALKRLEKALHTARVQGSRRLTAITGRGLGNASGTPVLRRRVEAWLAVEGRRYGATRWEPTSRGGALEIHLAPREPEQGAGGDAASS